MLDKLNKFHETRIGYAVFAVFGLVVAYLFISWAIDSGNWYDYLIFLFATVVFLQNLTKLIGSFFRAKRPSRKAR